MKYYQEKDEFDMELYRKFDNVPSVITKTMIMNEVNNSAPSSVCKKLFKRKKLEYEYIFKLYLESKDIVKIDHLWMLKNLKILSLAHNSIEEIENLEELINLKHLDLSFNELVRIEGLSVKKNLFEGLKSIEILILYNNKIRKIENLDDQENLAIFSIGNNLIEGRDCILYLRRFKKLLSLNMANNPCTNIEYLKESIAAYVPSLLYYEYKLISHNDRQIGLDYNAKDLELLEIEETKKLKEQEQLRRKKEYDDFMANAFIEGLSPNQLYTRMFHNDYEGRAFKEIGEHTLEPYERLRSSMNEICMDIIRAGEENYSKRMSEVQLFNQSWEQNQKSAEQQAFHQQVQLLRMWKHFVRETGKFLNANKTEMKTNDITTLESIINQFRAVVRKAKETFEDQWYKMMEVEMKMYEKNEAVINLYESCLTEIINIFIEKAQSFFTVLRDSETDFIDDISVKLNRYMVEVHQKDDKSNVPPILRNIVCDKDSLSNAIVACHDRHTLAIDTREDYIVSKLKDWHHKETAHLLKAETERNRNSVLKIRDSVDRAYRLYEKKASIMLNYFKKPEPLFVKTGKIEKMRDRSSSDESDVVCEESPKSSETSSQENYMKQLVEQEDFDETVDWTKLFSMIMEEVHVLSPDYSDDLIEEGEVEGEEYKQTIDKGSSQSIEEEGQEEGEVDDVSI